MVWSFRSSAKEVYFHTNDINATYMNYQKTEYTPEPIKWEEDGTAHVTLPDNKGVNVNINKGYLSQYIAVNGEEVVKSFSGSFYLTPAMLPDGCTVEIMTSEQQAVNVVVVGNPDHLKVKYMYHEYGVSEWTDGKVIIPIIDNMLNVVIEAREKYGIKYVSYNGKDVYGGDINNYTIYSTNLVPGDNVYEIETFLLADERTSTFTVDVTGDPSMVEVIRAGDTTNILTGKALEEPIPFNPDFDLPVTVQNVHYNMELYKVMVDDVEIPAVDNMYWILELKDGDVIKVDVDYPDVMVPIRFDFVNSETEGSISSINRIVDGIDQSVPADEWKSEGWSVPMGTMLTVYLNVNDFDLSVSLNGVDIDSTKGYLSFIANDESGYDLRIVAEPRDPFVVVISYESLPAHFKVRIGATGEDYVEMTGKDSTKVKVPRNRNRVRIIPDEDWIIQSVVVDGRESNTEDIPITNDNMYIDVFMEEFVRDLEAIFYLDPATDWGYKAVTLSPEVRFREKSLSLETGYNLVKYNEADLPIAVEVVLEGQYNYPCFVNGEQLPMPVPSIDELVPGSVVRMYGEYPAFYNVKFTVEPDAPVTVYRDIIDIIGNPGDQEVMAGTRYDIVPEDINEVIVTVGGVIQSAVDGRYVVTADSDLDIEVKKGDPSGVAGVESDCGSDVFSLQGIRLLKNATPSQIKRLPAGIYIVSGKKMVVR